jgi:hypothetical protein
VCSPAGRQRQPLPDDVAKRWAWIWRVGGAARRARAPGPATTRRGLGEWARRRSGYVVRNPKRADEQNFGSFALARTPVDPKATECSELWDVDHAHRRLRQCIEIQSPYTPNPGSPFCDSMERGYFCGFHQPPARVLGQRAAAIQLAGLASVRDSLGRTSLRLITDRVCPGLLVTASYRLCTGLRTNTCSKRSENG